MGKIEQDRLAINFTSQPCDMGRLTVDIHLTPDICYTKWCMDADSSCCSVVMTTGYWTRSYISYSVVFDRRLAVVVDTADLSHPQLKNSQKRDRSAVD